MAFEIVLVKVATSYEVHNTKYVISTLRHENRFLLMTGFAITHHDITYPFKPSIVGSEVVKATTSSVKVVVGHRIIAKLRRGVQLL